MLDNDFLNENNVSLGQLRWLNGTGRHPPPITPEQAIKQRSK
jgi:hypothetical protein